MGGLSQRTDYVEDVVACIQAAELGGRESHLLYNQCDGSFGQVSTGYGERHAFTHFIDTYDDKVASLTRLCNQRSLHFELEHFLRKLFLANDFVHYTLFAMFFVGIYVSWVEFT